MNPGMSKYSCVVFVLLVFVSGLNACTPPASRGSAKSASSKSAMKGECYSGQEAGILAATFDNQSISLREIDAELGESLHEARKHTATRMAFEAIANGAAREKLEQFRAYTRKLNP
jgi:hypothetical protein